MSKSPLGIFVLWHPEFKEGQEYADLIFSEFKRNVSDPLSRGMNIPVWFRYVAPLMPIDTREYEFTIVVALIESEFVLDDHYKEYLAILSSAASSVLVIPAAIERTAFNAGMGNINLARLYERDNKKEYLVNIIAHEAIRHLNQWEEVLDRIPGSSSAPLRLFISHAKADGVEIAYQIKATVEKSLPLKTFFDANDIAVAYDFSKEIEENISKAVIIAVHTDMYSSREWCRREILLAKEHNRPIVILNCFHSGESRSFPYMANVLTVHYMGITKQGYSDSSVWNHLITAVLKETLRLIYVGRWIRYVADLRNHPLSPHSISAYPPELVTVLRKRQSLNNLFVYPEPPLGSEELAILALLDQSVKYLIPSDL